MDEAFRRIVTWFAPILCFTMEEAWLARFPGDKESVHLQTFFAVPKSWANPALIEKWTRIRELRRVITGALELERAAKKIGSSLEAAPTLYLADEADADLLASVALAEVAITSGINILAVAAPQDAFTLPDIKGASVAATLASGEKCARCWMVLEEVKTHPATHLCNRCTDAVAALEPT
jgi:isoleucyl-tRNA synthetase